MDAVPESALEAARARAHAVRRALDAFERAGFDELRAPELETSGGLRRALDALVPCDAPLPQRLVVATHARGEDPDLVALVLHDGRATALEAELATLAADALARAGRQDAALKMQMPFTPEKVWRALNGK